MGAERWGFFPIHFVVWIHFDTSHLVHILKWEEKVLDRNRRYRMFPGMRGPEPLPDHESHTAFWKAVNKFVSFSIAAISISLAVRYIERKSENIIIGSV